MSRPSRRPPPEATLRRAAQAAFALALAWPLGGPIGLAHAERADRDQPLKFSADRMRLDEKRKVRVLTGDVEISRGTLVIRAAQIELRETPQGEVAVATGAAGKPASFRQKRDGVDETVEGQAQRVEYDAGADMVRFVQQAVVRRYRAGTLSDEVTGQLITYDSGTEVIEVQGGDASAASGSGRVRGVLAPRATPASAPR